MRKLCLIIFSITSHETKTQSVNRRHLFGQWKKGPAGGDTPTYDHKHTAAKQDLNCKTKAIGIRDAPISWNNVFREDNKAGINNGPTVFVERAIKYTVGNICLIYSDLLCHANVMDNYLVKI